MCLVAYTELVTCWPKRKFYLAYILEIQRYGQTYVYVCYMLCMYDLLGEEMKFFIFIFFLGWGRGWGVFCLKN